MPISARPLSALFALATLGSCLFLSPRAFAIGESVAGFPNYDERLLHELANRARVDPQLEMTQCGSNCAEASCYTPQPPLYYVLELNHAARFHAAHMEKNGYFSHTSSCTLVENIGTLFPDGCDGSASCACAGGQNMCNPDCNDFSSRINLFGGKAGGEIIASTGGGAESAFYLWLYEPTKNTTCDFTGENGHRNLLLKAPNGIGFGYEGKYVGDFGGEGAAYPIASGSHLPRQADKVEAWANWSDMQGPKSALVNVDGTCTPMKLTRGTVENGAYEADLTGVGTGCHRYFFKFEDASGKLVTYPETGSLGIGPEGTCADWSEERPQTGQGCECTAQCSGKQCGDDACGGSCGTCEAGSMCSADGECVSDEGGDASCGCEVPGGSSRSAGSTLGLGLLGLALLGLRRRPSGRS